MSFGLEVSLFFRIDLILLLFLGLELSDVEVVIVFLEPGSNFCPRLHLFLIPSVVVINEVLGSLIISSTHDLRNFFAVPLEFLEPVLFDFTFQIILLAPKAAIVTTIVVLHTFELSIDILKLVRQGFFLLSHIVHHASELLLALDS